MLAYVIPADLYGSQAWSSGFLRKGDVVRSDLV